MNEVSPGSQEVGALIAVFRDRIARFADRDFVVTYDGSVQDRVLLELLRRYAPDRPLTVLCGVRPCMDEALKAEVRAFASRGGLDLVDIEGVCEVEGDSYIVKVHRCAEIGPPLKALVAGGGLRLIASISRSAHLEEMRAAFQALGGEGEFLEDAGGGACGWTRGGQVANLLVFHQFLPQDLLALHDVLFDRLPREHQAPICLAPCYYELEKMKLVRLIRRATLSQARS